MRVGYTTTFEMAHRLRCHQGKCRNLHGHTYRFQIVVEGEIQDNGMVVDFYRLKGVVNEVLSKYDHAACFNEEDTLVEVLRSSDPNLDLVVLNGEPTVENMLLLIVVELQPWFRGLGSEVVSARLYETPDCWAEFQA